MRRPLRIQVIPSAAKQIREARVWWQENSNSSILQEVLEHAFDLLSLQPFVGAPALNVKLAGVRRLHLNRIHYYLYYRVAEKEERVEVLALWHTSRGTLPKL